MNLEDIVTLAFSLLGFVLVGGFVVFVVYVLTGSRHKHMTPGHNYYHGKPLMAPPTRRKTVANLQAEGRPPLALPQIAAANNVSADDPTLAAFRKNLPNNEYNALKEAFRLAQGMLPRAGNARVGANGNRATGIRRAASFRTRST